MKPYEAVKDSSNLQAYTTALSDIFGDAAKSINVGEKTTKDLLNWKEQFDILNGDDEESKEQAYENLAGLRDFLNGEGVYQIIMTSSSKYAEAHIYKILEGFDKEVELGIDMEQLDRKAAEEEKVNSSEKKVEEPKQSIYDKLASKKLGKNLKDKGLFGLSGSSAEHEKLTTAFDKVNQSKGQPMSAEERKKQLEELLVAAEEYIVKKSDGRWNDNPNWRPTSPSGKKRYEAALDIIKQTRKELGIEGDFNTKAEHEKRKTIMNSIDVHKTAEQDKKEAVQDVMNCKPEDMLDKCAKMFAIAYVDMKHNEDPKYMTQSEYENKVSQVKDYLLNDDANIAFVSYITNTPNDKIRSTLQEKNGLNKLLYNYNQYMKKYDKKESERINEYNDELKREKAIRDENYLKAVEENRKKSQEKEEKQINAKAQNKTANNKKIENIELIDYNQEARKAQQKLREHYESTGEFPDPNHSDPKTADMIRTQYATITSAVFFESKKKHPNSNEFAQQIDIFTNSIDLKKIFKDVEPKRIYERAMEDRGQALYADVVSTRIARKQNQPKADSVNMNVPNKSLNKTVATGMNRNS